MMAILQSVCYGTLMVLVDHSSPSYRHRMEMIIDVPEWLIEWLMGNILCKGPKSSNLSLKSRNISIHILDELGCTVRSTSMKSKENKGSLIRLKLPEGASMGLR